MVHRKREQAENKGMNLVHRDDDSIPTLSRVEVLQFEARHGSPALSPSEEEALLDQWGSEWLGRYVSPFQMVLDGYSAGGTKEQRHLSEIRDLSLEVAPNRIVEMLRMHWRMQVQGAWYAIARRDPAFAPHIHASLETCYGYLSAPSLMAAMLVYPTEDTVECLRAYRERDIANVYWSSATATAALIHLGVADDGFDLPDGERHAFDAVLDSARRLHSDEDLVAMGRARRWYRRK